MKKLLALAGSCAAVCVWCVSAPNANAQGSGFYVKGDVGGNFTSDVTVKEFFGVPLLGTKLELDPGIRAGIAGGYQVTDWFAAEAELGFMINEISSVGGAGYVHDATLSNVPFLVNAKFQYPMKRCPVTPYAGVGAGFSESIFDADALRIGTVVLSGSDATTVFAWQAFAGMRYEINERMGLAVEYRYFEADSASWDADTFHTVSDTFALGRTHTHNVSLAFDFRF